MLGGLDALAGTCCCGPGLTAELCCVPSLLGCLAVATCLDCSCNALRARVCCSIACLSLSCASLFFLVNGFVNLGAIWAPVTVVPYLRERLEGSKHRSAGASTLVNRNVKKP